jgi:hypothetical protein
MGLFVDIGYLFGQHVGLFGGSTDHHLIDGVPANGFENRIVDILSRQNGDCPSCGFVHGELLQHLASTNDDKQSGIALCQLSWVCDSQVGSETKIQMFINLTDSRAVGIRRYSNHGTLGTNYFKHRVQDFLLGSLTQRTQQTFYCSAQRITAQKDICRPIQHIHIQNTMLLHGIE